MTEIRTSRRTLLATGAVLSAAAAVSSWPTTAHAHDNNTKVIPEPLKVPEAVGRGGAVASVDPYATEIGLKILRSGGNAVDAAIAAAAALGVTEPFSSGIGGGGFFVYRDARTGKVWTINGRETAPRTFSEKTFTDAGGTALNFNTVVTSGLSVGTPGTLLTWDVAARRFGTRTLAELMGPAEELARRGFVVDDNFRDQTAAQAERFVKFPASADLFLPGGLPPEVGSTFRNPDLAETYRRLRKHGLREFYNGRIGQALVAEAQRPTTAPGVSVLPGQLTLQDLRDYSAPVQPPTHSRLRNLDVYGMGVPSSGGIAVGEILNLIQAYAKRTGVELAALSEVDYLHRLSEASATAFADRNRWVGDIPGVPVAELLSMDFARERAALFDPKVTQTRPIPFGSPDGDYANSADGRVRQTGTGQGQSTTHLNVVDRWGNVVSYTLTIEQTGGSAITVPGHGFLLNNELTDFNFVPLTAGVPDPNLPGPGKRPRSSMSPTILTDRRGPVLAVGTPGGATIITTVAQIILGHLERGMPLVKAIAAPRLSSRNAAPETYDLDLTDSQTRSGLKALGHELTPQTLTGGWIGNASGIRIEGQKLTAAAETVRGYGGSAGVVRRN